MSKTVVIPRTFSWFRQRLSLSKALVLVDFMLYGTLLAQMLQQYQSASVHEYLGIFFSLMLVFHIILHRRWFLSLLKGRWNGARVVRVMVVGLSLLCGVVLVASGLGMSKILVGFTLIQNNSELLRSMHLVSTYGSFVAFSLHIGIQMNLLSRMSFKKKQLKKSLSFRVFSRLGSLVVFLAGVLCFVHLDLVAYITGSVPFAFIDTSVSVFQTLFEFVLVGAAFIELGSVGIWCARTKR